MNIIKYFKGRGKFRKEVMKHIKLFYNFNDPEIWDLTTRIIDEDVIYYIRNQFNKKRTK